jgi:CheY-like chemotaxis protein
LGSGGSVGGLRTTTPLAGVPFFGVSCATGGADDGRFACSGPLVVLDARAAVQLALVLHELATNARKYGALSIPDGQLTLRWKIVMQAARELVLEWKESGVKAVRAPRSQGFGTTRIERTLEACGGTTVIQYGADGVVCEIRLPLPSERQQREDALAAVAAQGADGAASERRGKRILVIEDEALVAMEIESHLQSAGYEVVGPAATVKAARQLIEKAPCDAALVDANLAGHPVDELAAALTQKGIPFAFATGYGRDALPLGYREAPLLTKPFAEQQLLVLIAALLGEGRRGLDVVPLRPKRA